MAARVYFCRLCLSSTLLFFDNLAYTKCILPKRSADEKYIKHHNRALTERCKIWGVKKLKIMKVMQVMDKYSISGAGI